MVTTATRVKKRYKTNNKVRRWVGWLYNLINKFKVGWGEVQSISWAWSEKLKETQIEGSLKYLRRRIEVIKAELNSIVWAEIENISFEARLVT